VELLLVLVFVELVPAAELLTVAMEGGPLVCC
jgi:hypothetical protein